MMKTSVRGACYPETTTGNLPAITSQHDFSCCKTVIAADRNNTEYIQTQKDETTQLINFSIIDIFYNSNIPLPTTYSKINPIDTHSPPLAEDIPIFTSSLLI
jgi:hypothetical protein